MADTATGSSETDTNATDEARVDAGVNEASGCSCRSDAAPRGFGPLGLAALGGWLRRR